MVGTLRAFIWDELDNIRFQADEIGIAKSMLETVTTDHDRQLWSFFQTFAEQEMEDAYERLKKLRAELAAIELR